MINIYDGYGLIGNSLTIPYKQNDGIMVSIIIRENNKEDSRYQILKGIAIPFNFKKWLNEKEA